MPKFVLNIKFENLRAPEDGEFETLLGRDIVVPPPTGNIFECVCVFFLLYNVTLVCGGGWLSKKELFKNKRLFKKTHRVAGRGKNVTARNRFLFYNCFSSCK